MMLKKSRGFILIAFYLVVVVLIILAVAYFSRSVSETRLAQRERNFVQALYLAEAGIDYALAQLRAGTSSGTNLDSDSWPGVGSYNCSWLLQTGSTNKWDINATGTAGDIDRLVHVAVEKKQLPDNFFDHALYSCGDAAFNGAAYEVHGDVIFSGSIKGDPAYIDGTTTQDSSIAPLIALDFVKLRETSLEQGNVYDAYRLKTDPLPSSFWYNQEQGIPNIVYIETDLTLNGNVGTVGGFFVVVGDVITDPSGKNDTTINGNGQIDGCIYTTGEFTVNGGGGGLNVLGGVWAGEEITLNGNANVTYNSTYMEVLEGLSLSTDYQIIFWEEL